MENSNLELEVNWDVIDASHGFAIDMGGSVLKLLYVDKKEWLEPSERKEAKGKLKIKGFTHAEFNDGTAYKYIKENVYIQQRADKKEPVVCSTGYMVSFNGSAMNKELGISIHCVMETDCFVQALHYAIKNMPRGQVVYKIAPEEVKGAQKFAYQLAQVYAQSWAQSQLYRKDSLNDISLDSGEEEENDDKPFITEKDIFPCVMAMCGSAFGFMPIYEDLTYGLTDVANRGGRMWLGLGSVLTGGSDYEELMKLAAAGSYKDVDFTSDDVRSTMPSGASAKDDSNAYTAFDFKDFGTFSVFHFAKAAGKTIGDFKKEDLARSLLDTLVSGLVTSTHDTAKSVGAKYAFFSGGFAEHPLTRSLIYREFVKIDTQSRLFNQTTVPIRCYFLKGGQHYGAFGALLNHQLKFADIPEKS